VLTAVLAREAPNLVPPSQQAQPMSARRRMFHGVRPVLARTALAILLVAGTSACTDKTPSELEQLATRVSKLEQNLEVARESAAERETELQRTGAEIRELNAQLDAASKLIEELQSQVASEATRRHLIESEIQRLQSQLCPTAGAELPDGTPEKLVAWLVSGLVESGEIGESEPTPLIRPSIEATAGSDSDWLFVASFDSHFEPAIFFTDGENFEVLWSGIAASEDEIEDYVLETNPEFPDDELACLDKSRFVGP
jgi:outer membrane murein-binding lipoprotein Lpp